MHFLFSFDKELKSEQCVPFFLINFVQDYLILFFQCHLFFSQEMKETIDNILL